jgi:hypothetical protein
MICVSAGLASVLLSGCAGGAPIDNINSAISSAKASILGTESKDQETSFSQESTTNAEKPSGEAGSSAVKETNPQQSSVLESSGSKPSNPQSKPESSSNTGNNNNSNTSSEFSGNSGSETSNSTSGNTSGTSETPKENENKTKGELDGYGDKTKDAPNKSEQVLKIGNKTFNVGDTAVATYYISAPYKITAYQGYIEYNSDCLEATNGTLGKAASNCAIVNYKPRYEGKILFNGSNLSGYDFIKGGVFLTIEYKVKAGGVVSPEFIWQELWDEDNNSVINGKSSNGEILTVSYSKK